MTWHDRAPPASACNSATRDTRVNTDCGDLVRRLWESIEARRWEDAAALLAPDLEIRWPHTGERIRGRENYIGLNRQYPEGWHIEILSVLSSDTRASIEARVPHESLGVSFVAGYYEVKDGLIQAGTEYWVDEASQDAPDWRRRWTAP